MSFTGECSRTEAKEKEKGNLSPFDLKEDGDGGNSYYMNLGEKVVTPVNEDQQAMEVDQIIEVESRSKGMILGRPSVMERKSY